MEAENETFIKAETKHRVQKVTHNKNHVRGWKEKHTQSRIAGTETRTEGETAAFILKRVIRELDTRG